VHDLNPHPDPDSILERLELFGMRLGLETMRALMDGFGDPHLDLDCVLIAGTNGKGSTAALLESIVRAAGYRTALYTSPHLEAVEERVKIAGRAVEREVLGARLAEVIEMAETAVGELPTYFEALTAAALLIFARADVDLAILEVGLGGRLDATNVVDPRLSLITRVAFDHEMQLGRTLPEIAREKAGILRSGRPGLAWSEEESVTTALNEAAAARGARLEFADRSVGVRPLSPPRPCQPRDIEVRTVHSTYSVQMPLQGDHQLSNLGLAIRAAELVRDLGMERVGGDAIRAGVETTAWPARLECIELPDGRRVLLDAAHNPDGIRALVDYLDQIAEPFDLLFGVLGDKRVEGMLPPLAQRARWITLTRPANPRALAVERLATLLAEPDRARVEADPELALADALERMDRLLVVCGSIYLVGAVRAALRRHFGVPAQAE